LFITIPILFIKDASIQRFLGLLVTKHLRLSMPQKIEFACEFCPQIKRDKALLKRVRVLLAYRNSILHSPPEYTEPLGLPDLEGEDLPSKITEEDLVRCPQLVLRTTSSLEVHEAFQHYQTALDFLRKLSVDSGRFQRKQFGNSG
jgi:hypothetical protein